jgi:hypothetical protein
MKRQEIKSGVNQYTLFDLGEDKEMASVIVRNASVEFTNCSFCSAFDKVQSYD